MNPTVAQIVDAISEQRIAATLQKLEGFGTRYVSRRKTIRLTASARPSAGFTMNCASYSPRLQVSYQDFTIKKGARQGQIIRDVELSNIVAVLPGTTQKDRYVLVTGALRFPGQVRKPYTGQEQTIAELVRRGIDESEARRYSEDPAAGARARARWTLRPPPPQTIAPGVTDDGSGTAAVTGDWRA